MTDAEFTDGDIIIVRGDEYVVEQIDRDPERGFVIQYRLKPIGDGLPARLKPTSDSADSEYTAVLYQSIGEDDIERVGVGA